MDSDRSQFVTEYENRALARMKERGFRVTLPRMRVVRVLATSDRALSVQEIFHKLRAMGDRVDAASIYRIVATLRELHLVHHIGIVDGYIACTQESEHGHESEHLVCDACGRIEEVMNPTLALQIAQDHLAKQGFRASEIKIEVAGRCRECASL